MGFTKALLEYAERSEICAVSGASMGMFVAYAVAADKLDVLEFMYRKIDIGRKRELLWQVFVKDLLMREICGFFESEDLLTVPMYFPISYFPIFSVKYYELYGPYNPLWKKYAAAAANFPFLKIFPNVLNHRFAIDGGAADNIPLFPLLKSREAESDGGFDIIFVLHFNPRYEYRREFVTDVPVLDLDVSAGNGFSKRHFDFSRAYVTEMLETSYEYGKKICGEIFSGALGRSELKRRVDEIFLSEHEVRQRHKSADGLVSVLNAIGKVIRSEKCGIEKLYITNR